MRQKSQWALISLWLILLGSFIHMDLTVMPVIAYNHPQRPFGWPFLILLLLSIDQVFYDHLINLVSHSIIKH
ncbi:hypothetical protein [Lactiplantibacillus plantarum]|uniref:hypothetical protein n=1 Tax=Lactiplantibacillus plantarum TaxID=1590 RepID=UPI0009771218|nr:hypothetical protein [Lactiplantibacillus plantarum]MCK8474825.1 hypothetical protein [Lactiplantibacillus plantarum]QCS76765.1 hypothetical protein FEM46_05530 [Lactiplantibacillus plantarum subsp. plantarum]RDD75754.1 hypothetical protein DVV32_14505 [Lactiplantibacillus plantarum]WHQ53674.1 hypothetical protein M1857_11625 [Lactiplantibacillus plantarum]